jgi:hypothetical protein
MFAIGKNEQKRGSQKTANPLKLLMPRAGLDWLRVELQGILSLKLLGFMFLSLFRTG